MTLAQSKLGQRIDALADQYVEVKTALEGHKLYTSLPNLTKAELPADLAQIIGRYETALQELAKEGINIDSMVQLKKPQPITIREYILMPQTSTWSLGKDALQKECQRTNNQIHPTYVLPDGSRVYCPLIIEENIRARVEDYHGYPADDPERLRLFNTWLDSCTGIAYKKGTNLCTLITQSQELIDLSGNFNKHFISINYNYTRGKEFDLSQIATGRSFTKAEILGHELWNYVVPDKKLLEEHVDIIFRERKIQQGMSFYVVNPPAED